MGAILADEALWEGGLPYPFSRNALLKELLNRVDSIQLLLQLLDKGAATYDCKNKKPILPLYGLEHASELIKYLNTFITCK